MSAEGDQELSVRTVLCLKPVSDGSLVRSRQSDYCLDRRMCVIELAMQRPRDGFRKALGVKRLAVDRLILSVIFRKGHPPPPWRSLHLSFGRRRGTYGTNGVPVRREGVVVNAAKRSAKEANQPNS